METIGGYVTLKCLIIGVTIMVCTVTGINLLEVPSLYVEGRLYSAPINHNAVIRFQVENILYLYLYHPIPSWLTATSLFEVTHYVRAFVLSTLFFLRCVIHYYKILHYCNCFILKLSTRLASV